MTAGKDAHAATLVAEGLARKLGFAAERPALVSVGSNVVIRVAPEGPVARVSGLVDRVRDTREHFRRDVALARHLAAEGAPAVRPVEPAGPHEVAGRVVTFWEWVPPAAPPGGSEIGRALVACHRALASYEGELPPLQRLLDEAVVVAGRGALTAEDRSYVRVELLRVADRIAELGLPERPIHGDSGLGNVLTGPRWNDWEDASIGPAEWDLACLVTTARVQDQDGPRAEAALMAAGGEPPEVFVRARALQATAWSSLAVKAGTTTPQRLARRLAWLRERAVG